jgi:hypothetical protein
MSDDLKNRGAQDRSRINVNEPWEVKHWTKELGVTEEQLRELVRQHGISADKLGRLWRKIREQLARIALN